jgi:hypothetical protein
MEFSRVESAASSRKHSGWDTSRSHEIQKYARKSILCAKAVMESSEVASQ